MVFERVRSLREVLYRMGRLDRHLEQKMVEKEGHPPLITVVCLRQSNRQTYHRITLSHRRLTQILSFSLAPTLQLCRETQGTGDPYLGTPISLTKVKIKLRDNLISIILTRKVSRSTPLLFHVQYSLPVDPFLSSANFRTRRDK